MQQKFTQQEETGKHEGNFIEKLICTTKASFMTTDLLHRLSQEYDVEDACKILLDLLVCNAQPLMETRISTALCCQTNINYLQTTFLSLVCLVIGYKPQR